MDACVYIRGWPLKLYVRLTYMYSALHMHIHTYIHMQLYHTDRVRSPRQLYVLVIVLLILTQDAAFNTGKQKLPSVHACFHIRGE